MKCSKKVLLMFCPKLVATFLNNWPHQGQLLESSLFCDTNSRFALLTMVMELSYYTFHFQLRCSFIRAAMFRGHTEAS
jgi:hypothetical protein